MSERLRRTIEVFTTFLRLGLTSFGGPVAHIGYFHGEFVTRRKWLGEKQFARIVALCQFLPGPASSQVGMIVGLTRAGALGAAAAWIGFTTPSAVVMTAFALGVDKIGHATAIPWIHGLLVAAVAVVAFAVWSMAQSLCPDLPRRLMAIAVAAAILVLPSTGLAQLGAIAAGAIFGLLLLKPEAPAAPTEEGVACSPRAAIACGVLFFALLLGLAIAQRLLPNTPLDVFARFYQTGALVFGGAHVVLPLLQAQVVPPGWISDNAFVAGYGAAQAIPGPLFTFSAYLGAAMHGPVHGVAGALLALFAIYLPSFLLIGAVLPFWGDLSRNAKLASAMLGINAAVVGLLVAALYRPVWVSAIRDVPDAALAVGCLLLLALLKAPPWVVVGVAALVTQFVLH